MGTKNIYERFVWFDDQVRQKKYPNATSLAGAFEISTKTAQRDIDFMRDRLLCPLDYDSSQKGYYYNDDAFSLRVFQNEEAFESLIRGIKDASEGKISKLNLKSL